MSIRFMWISAPVGLRVNEEVERLSKQALHRDSLDLQVPLSKSEVKVMVWSKVAGEWQEEWNNERTR